MYVPHSSAACLAALRFCHFCVCFPFRSHFVSLLFLRFVLVCLLFLVELSRGLSFSIFYLSSSPSRFLQSFNERGGGRVSLSLAVIIPTFACVCVCSRARASQVQTALSRRLALSPRSPSRSEKVWRLLLFRYFVGVGPLPPPEQLSCCSKLCKRVVSRHRHRHRGIKRAGKWSTLTCIVRIVVSSSSPPLLPRLFHSAFLFHFFGFCVPSLILLSPPFDARFIKEICQNGETIAQSLTSWADKLVVSRSPRVFSFQSRVLGFQFRLWVSGKRRTCYGPQSHRAAVTKLPTKSQSNNRCGLPQRHPFLLLQ